MLFARCSSIDISGAVDRKRGDFLFRRAIKNECVAIRGDAIDQAASIRTGDQISLWVKRKHANVDLVALEEQRILSVGIDLIDLATIAGCHIKAAGIIEHEIPDVFGGGIKIDGGAPTA